MRVGPLRHRVSFQTRSSATDASGQNLDDWTDLVTVWGQVEDLVGAEQRPAGGYSAQVSTVITIRHRAGVSAGMRAVVGSRTFEIVGPPVDKTGRSRESEIACREVTP